MSINPASGFEPFDFDGNFSRHCGTVYRMDRGDETVWGFLADDIHNNPNNVVHGGLLMSFVDTVMGQTVEEVAGRLTATISLNVEFVASSKVPCWIEARVKLTRLARTLAFVRAEITQSDNTLLTASGIWRVFDRESARVRVLRGSSP